MKSTELFDLLGEIDDKFYEEARIPDELHGDEVVSEHRPFSGFMSIFLPIAACVAIIVAVAVGANFVKRNAGIVPPNTFDSDSSADASISSDSGVSSDDVNSSSSSEESSVPVQDDGQIRLEDYPLIDLATVPDIKGWGLQVQIEQQEKTLQNATLATLNAGDYKLYLLGNFIHIDKSDDPNRLFSYYISLALVKDGETLFADIDNTHTTSVSMGQGGFKLAADDLDNYIEYYELNGAELIIFKYHEPGQSYYECTFFTITDDGKLMYIMGDQSATGGISSMNANLNDGYTVDTEANTITDGDTIFIFDCEKFGLNPHENSQYITKPNTADNNIDLSEYPMVNISEIPDVGDNPNDTTNALPKATIAQKQVGEYTLSIIGENIRTSFLIQKGDDLEFMADSVCSIISKDGEIIRVTGENGTGVRTLMLTEEEAYDLLPDAYEMKDGIVFGLDKKSLQLSGLPSFGKVVTVQNSKMIEFTADYYTVFTDNDSDPYMGVVPVGSGDDKVTVLYEENALIRGNEKFTFDFDNLRVTLSQVGVDMADNFDLSFYKEFDDSAINTLQERVIFDVKECGEYKLYLLGHGVKIMPDERITFVDFAGLYIAVEKGGKIVECIAADNTVSLVGLKISDYIKPFEMKDGTGFVMYYAFEPWGGIENYAMLYKIENDTVTKLRYEYDFAPAPATGSAQYVGDFEVDFEKNALVDDDGTIIIDFNSNKYSRS